MRIYNAKKGQLTLPLTSGNNLVISSFAPSMEFVPNRPFLESIVRNFDYSELAIIISGPYELSLCSEVSCLAGFLVNSLDEAVAKFAPKEEKKADIPAEEVEVVEDTIPAYEEVDLTTPIVEDVSDIALDVEIPKELEEVVVFPEEETIEESKPTKKNKKNKN